MEGHLGDRRLRRLLDLTGPLLAADNSRWRDPVEYGPCQALADAAREAGAETVGYELVRDPVAGAAVAVLACTAFAKPKPLERQTWKIGLGAKGARAVCEFPPARLEFDRAAFAADPRLEGMIWSR